MAYYEVEVRVRRRRWKYAIVALIMAIVFLLVFYSFGGLGPLLLEKATIFVVEKAREVAEASSTVNVGKNALEEVARWYELHDEEDYDWLLSNAIERAEEIAPRFERPTLRETLIELMEFIALELAYYPDPVVKYVDPNTGEIKSRDQVYSMPDEVLQIGGGDCEDLALFAYAVLKSLGYRAYIIVYVKSDVGHWAVLVEDADGFYLFDPAGLAWLNGVWLGVELRLIDDVGRRRTICLSPIGWSRDVREKLAHGVLADIVYYDPREGYCVEEPRVRAEPNLEELLYEWLEGKLLYIDRLELHDVGLHLRFETIDELVEWFEARG